MNLSVTIITLNEEGNIKRCINSVKNIASELILVDSGSTDKTIDVAEKFGAKVFEREFDNYANQKNYASRKAAGKWILSLDADEIITPELAKEIKRVIMDPKYNGFLMPRKNILLGVEIKHTRWSPDKHIWLWRKREGKWVGKVHEEVVVDGKVGELVNAKVHYSYKNVSEFVNMMNNYTDRIAKEKISKGEGFSYFKMFYEPTLSFFRRFLYKKGFLDGWRGFVLSYLMAIYRLTTWIKVWEVSR